MTRGELMLGLMSNIKYVRAHQSHDMVRAIASCLSGDAERALAVDCGASQTEVASMAAKEFMQEAAAAAKR